MGFECGFGSRWRSDGKFRQRFVRATWHWNFSADNVHQIRSTKFFYTSLFCDLCKPGGTHGNNGIGQRNRIICARHAAVEMDLFETCRDIATDELVRVTHGFFCGQSLPTVRTQVIAPQNELLAWEVIFICHLFDKTTEVFRCHSGIAAVLIDLIRRCFY